MEKIDLKPEYLELVNLILKKHVPGKIVWAYGSRVTGNSKPQSDLDIVVFDADNHVIGDLKDAFSESDLPFRVDVMDWKKIPDNFKKNISELYVVIQHPDRR